MHIKQITFLLISIILLMALFATVNADKYTSSATWITEPITTNQNVIQPAANQSVIYYFKVLNANILGLSTNTQATATPITPQTQNTILYHEPTLSAECINKLLASKSSQAAGNGQAFVDFSKQYNIDTAFILGVFNAESTMGTAGTALHTHSIGNETCAAADRENSQKCYKSDRIIDGKEKTFYYKISPSWKDGIEHIYKFFTTESYYVKAGRTTIDSVAPWYVEGKAYPNLTSAESERVQTWIKNVKDIYDKYPQSC